MMRKAMIFSMIFLLTAGLMFAAGQREVTDEVVIEFWHQPSTINVPGFEDVSQEYGDFEAYLAEKFSAQHDGITLTTRLVPWEGIFETFNIAIAGGNPPAIGMDYLGRTSQYNAMGALTPLEDFMPQYIIDDAADVRNLFEVDGKMHALPAHAWNYNTMVVNVGLLKYHGWEGPILNGPGEPYTHEEWVDFLYQVRATVPDGIFPTVWKTGDEQGDYGWWAYFWGFGAEMFGPDGKVTTNPDPIVEALELITYLRDNNLTPRGIASMRANESNEMWYAGNVVMNMAGFPHAEALRRSVEAEGAYDFEVMAVPFPTRDGDTGFNVFGPTAYAFFTEDPRELEAAVKFIEFMMYDEDHWIPMMKSVGQFMVQESYADVNLYEGNEFQELVAEMIERFDTGNFGLTHPQYQRIRISMAEALQKYFTGMVSAEQAVDEYLTAIRRLNDEL